MTCDYASIRADNERRYGTDIGRIGPMLLADRYDDRTHFIFELLQNAEDALAGRPSWQGARAVHFTLSANELRISHFGRPFDGRDVLGICGIAENTKDLTAIGRFGIGFKSVYAFTDRPEVHSGGEDFAIESFVWPTAIPVIEREVDETVFILPLRAGDALAHAEIADGLRRLGSRTLLFLRQIEEIAWRVVGGPSGLYLRSKPEEIGENVRRISLIGEEHDRPEVEETWRVFSREARTDEGTVAGHVEIAFSMAHAEESGQWSVQAVSDSPLAAFFPTVLPTHLGFLVQGPYRTTPSRDNVPRNVPWNQHLVQQTATLLVEALRWLRDHDMLDTAVLRCLPLDRARFAEGSMFTRLFEVVRNALASEPLLPRFGGSHVAASKAKLARTQELRELFSPSQLGTLFGTEGELAWLSGDISQDRTPELRQYVMRELGIPEVTPETILPKLDKAFLEAQSDDWCLKLYEFLNGQPALRSQGRLADVPVIRLEDGTQVVAKVDGEPQAFLPSAMETGFPTVRRAVCATEEARKFLQSLGLTEPDPVDDVVRNVLPRYRGDEVDVSHDEYEADIRRILTAFGTDSKTQREKLVAALRDSDFVMAVDAGDTSKSVSKPGNVYLATERLKDLFAGVGKVLLVDDSYACLRGEDVRDLLEACGATRYLQPVRVEDFTWEQRREMRVAAGCKNLGRHETLEDYTLRGLDWLLGAMPNFDIETRARKAELLWQALADMQDRCGAGIFSGTYDWTYYGDHSVPFDAAFVRRLKGTDWVPDTTGELQRPEFVLFESLGWNPNPFLLAKIRFKPPIIETLAEEAGIEPGVLDLLKKHGLTSVAELLARLGIEDQPVTPDTPGTRSGGPSRPGTGPTAGGRAGSQPEGAREGSGKRTPGSIGGRPFISYVGAHPHDEEPDSDGLDQQARMALEEKAIVLIMAGEPQLLRTPTHNPGYDLFEAGEDGQPTRWIEVKAMTGSLSDRPVGLSRAQFECARERGAAYLLYVVEHAGDADGARIVRIQDPVGKARTFTFDHGWLSVAEESGASGRAKGQEGQ